MRPCISQATTLSTPFATDVEALALAGWSEVELWLTKLEDYLASGQTPAQALTLLRDKGLRPVAASAQGGLLLSTGAERAEHWGLFRRRLELLAELEVPTLIVAADFVRDFAPEDYARAAGSLAEASELARGSGVRLALEFQKGSPFCSSLDTALALVAQSGAGNLGVCLDLFHYYTGPSKFEDLAYLTSENLGWVQASDLSGIPRELAGDGDRILPGEGEFQIGPILDHLTAIGYDGYVSLELFNPMFWSIPAEHVADAGRRAMGRLLDREPTPGRQPSRGVS